MIGFFPDPYPDELLYSTCARYLQRVNYINKQSVTEELFGKKGFSAIVDFPTHIETLSNVIPNNNYSAKELIDNNTLLPFFEPFLPDDRAIIVRREMIDSRSSYNISARLGIRANQLLSPDYLRFCPVCVENDRKNYEETYWHRLHQISGIVICPQHLCFLENSFLKWNKKVSLSFQAADEFVISTQSRPINLNDKDHQILLQLSIDAKWLLSHSNLLINNQIIQQRYFNHLLKQGFAYYNGRVRNTKFIAACNEFFSPQLFNIIGRVSEKNNWLSILVEKNNTNVVYHPIRHLLLMNFLGVTAEEFFTSFVEFKPFGDPPYPCLNKGSNHYGKMTITKCDVFDNLTKTKRKKGRPIGYFECDCGFIYQRIGPDESEQDKFTYSYMREYGQIWELKFSELWANLEISGAEIGRKLDINSTTVGRHAIRLKLPMNTGNTRTLQGYRRHRNPKRSFSQRRLDYRKEWLEVIKVNTTLTRQQLMNAANFLYLWLARNDSEWFEQHLPQVEKVTKKGKYLDWNKIDQNLSEKVEKVCDEILEIKTFPVRVSITEIIRRIGKKKWIEKRKQKLPLTNEVINKKNEPLEKYMLRKVKWAIDYFIEHKMIPSKSQLKLKAVVRNNTSEKSKKIQKMLDQALKEIEKKIHIL